MLIIFIFSGTGAENRDPKADFICERREYKKALGDVAAKRHR